MPVDQAGIFKSIESILGPILKQFQATGGAPTPGLPGRVGGVPPGMVAPPPQAGQIQGGAGGGGGIQPQQTIPQMGQVTPALAPVPQSSLFQTGFEFRTKAGVRGATTASAIQGVSQFINDQRKRREEQQAKEAQNLMTLLMEAQKNLGNPGDPQYAKNKAIIDVITNDPKKMKILEKAYGEVMKLGEQPELSPAARGVTKAVEEAKKAEQAQGGGGGGGGQGRMLPSVTEQDPMRGPAIEAQAAGMKQQAVQKAIQDSEMERQKKDIEAMVSSGVDRKEATQLVVMGKWPPRPNSMRPVKGELNGQPFSAYFDPSNGRYMNPATGDDISGMFKPLTNAGRASKYADFMKGKAAQYGGELSPDQTIAAIREYSKMTQPPISEIEARAAATARGRVSVEGGELTPVGQKTLTDIESTRSQMDDLMQKLEPLKDNNTVGYFFTQRLKYAAGYASDEALLAGDIANLELAKITGALPYATRSRNYKYIQDIYKHLPSVWKDSPKMMYEKLSVSRGNFDRIADDVAKYEVKHARSDRSPSRGKDGGKTGSTTTEAPKDDPLKLF